MTTTVSLVGSTGSIGTQALDVIRAEPGRYRVMALAAATSVDALAAQAEEFRPEVVAVGDASLASKLEERLPPGVEVWAGNEALVAVATDADVVVNGVVGFAGLPVTMAALGAGRRLALANKESLIAGGPVVQRVRATPGAEIVPVDSEHCAVHQCLRGNPLHRVRRIVLTASGGPFRGRSREALVAVSVEEALAHPTWSMGPKITVDSSTLMNKGLEVIEAFHLFPLGADAFEVVVHPQSVVHSLVEYVDGSVLAQLGSPDMRIPIAYTLAYPERIETPCERLDLLKVGSLDFEAPDEERFPALRLAKEALRAGAAKPAILNAANEIAVASFLDSGIAFLDIAAIVRDTLDAYDPPAPRSLDEVLEVDGEARRRAREMARKFQN